MSNSLALSPRFSLSSLPWNSLPRLAVLAGPAGTGKTRACLDYFSELLKGSKNSLACDLLYVLPTAEHRERIIDLMLRKETNGFFGERIVTLRRLTQEFLKAGDFYLATDVERRFLLNELIHQTSGNYFAPVRGFPGFLEKMGDFIGELKESLVSLQTFKEGMRRLKKARPEMGEKYDALLDIYEAYETRLESLGLKDHRDGLFLLKKLEKEVGVRSSRPMSHSGKQGGARLRVRQSRETPPLQRKFRHLFIDGFFDFSPSQFGFLSWLAERSERITLTLSADLSAERKTLFEIPLGTLEELKKIGFKAVDFSQEENKRTVVKELRHVEKELFNSQPIVRSPCNDDAIFIFEATGIRGEAEMIAREIRRLVRTEGLNFSDIAVILRRIGEYESILRSVFRRFDIPVEIHERERLRNAPLARTLASFFKILLGDWQRDDLFNFLKSSYVDSDYQEVCRLEMQALDRGILGGRERWRKEISSPLFEKIADFQDRFAGEHTLADFIRLTEAATQSFGLTRIPEIYEPKTRRDFAALKRLRGLLAEIQRSVSSGGESRRSFESFAQEFLGLMEVDLFSLHERDKNLVQVYDVSLARQKEYKVVFAAGLLEKGFPAEIREDPVLSDEERRVVGLAERLPRQSLERYFFYTALARAREKIILSYPRFDLEGREALPSFYVDEVQRLFAAPLPKRVYPVSEPLPRLEDAVEEREVEAHLIRRLWQRQAGSERSARNFTVALYNRFLEKESFRDFIPRLLFEPVAQIKDKTIRAAFLPKNEIFKPTGLEIYGRCPFRYFASQFLQLEESEEGIDARQVGTVLHDVLESYWTERTLNGKKELGEMESAKAFVKEKLRELLEKEPLSGERRYRIELKTKEMEEWLTGMVEKEITDGSPLEPLHPRYFEYEFGFRRGKDDYLKLHDPFREDLKLRGKIDRIDVDPSGKYALVIDYKTGSEFKQAALDFGTALQLPLYLVAVQQRLGLKPVGAQIYTINKAETKGFYLKEAVAEMGIDLGRSRSVYERKKFDEIIQRAVHFSFKFAEGIRGAEINVRPRDCDAHCPFPSVCRIEKWRLRLIQREIQEEDKKAKGVRPGV